MHPPKGIYSKSSTNLVPRPALANPDFSFSGAGVGLVAGASSTGFITTVGADFFSGSFCLETTTGFFVLLELDRILGRFSTFFAIILALITRSLSGTTKELNVSYPSASTRTGTISAWMTELGFTRWYAKRMGYYMPTLASPGALESIADALPDSAEHPARFEIVDGVVMPSERQSRCDLGAPVVKADTVLAKDPSRLDRAEPVAWRPEAHRDLLLRHSPRQGDPHVRRGGRFD